MQLQRIEVLGSKDFVYIRAICFCCKRGGKSKRIRMYSSSQITDKTKAIEEMHKSVSPLQHKDEVENKEELREEATGVRLINLSKRFKEFNCCKKSSYIQAVQNVFLEIEKNEIVGLLGHNGAGKTTLINILTGLMKQTKGSAKFCGGLNLEEDMSEIQKIISVVPQFDLLWDQLSARQHVRLFAQIKGINLALVPNLVREHLQLVNLEDVSTSLVKSFSGGMKRRLSLTLGGVGNPRLIIMDEPTTGMDPLSRREAWKFIHTLRHQRALLITTHSMEEADTLCDRIAIIKKGEIQCVGTSLALKNYFGEGYNVEVLVDKKKGNATSVIHLMKELAPSCQFVNESGGSMIFNIKANEVFPFFEIIGKNFDEETSTSNKIQREILKELKPLISDLSISHTTLEEVFMKVTVSN